MVDVTKSVGDEEWYASTYAHFFRILNVLTKEAEVQCKIGQFHNVAWELKADFLSLSDLVLKLPGGKLSEKQRSSIERLAIEVGAIPDEVVNVANTPESLMMAMRDPHWQHIRAQVAKFLLQLESETSRVHLILFPMDGI